MLIALGPEERARSGYTGAEEVFVGNMKRLRIAAGLSQSELADRVVALGGAMYQQTIAKLESGQRALKVAEADLIAAALGSSLPDMFRRRSRSVMGAMTMSQLKVDLEASKQRQLEITRRADEAAQEASVAQHRLYQAQVEASQANNLYETLKGQYHKLVREMAAAVHAEDEDPPITFQSPRQQVDEHIENCKACQRRLELVQGPSS